MDIVQERLEREDAVEGGWLLDGFPRTAGQARLLLEGPLKPDAVVVLDRPDDLAVAFCLGRCEDSATGAVYHPRSAPPLMTCATASCGDGRTEVVKTRLAKHAQECNAVLATFEEAGVPVKVVNNARSELETFADCCSFVDEVEASMSGLKARRERKQKRRDKLAAPWRLMEAYKKG